MLDPQADVIMIMGMLAFTFATLGLLATLINEAYEATERRKKRQRKIKWGMASKGVDRKSIWK